MKEAKSIYFNEINKISLLTIEEERDLIKKAAEGDKKAQDKLVISNLRYVVKVANKYKNRGLNIEDLIEAGNIGLIKAATKVNPNWNNRFISYANWWIISSIQELILNMGSDVRLPGSQRKELSNPDRYFDSLDRVVQNGKGDSFTLGSLLEDETYSNPEEAILTNERRKELYDAIKSLTPNERKVLLEYYGFDGSKKSFTNIGAEMGYTKQGISCIEKRAIEKIRDYMHEFDDNLVA